MFSRFKHITLNNNYYSTISRMTDGREQLLELNPSEQTSTEDFRCRNNCEQSHGTKTLSLFFASLCIIDLFGVFPIVVLPRCLILCGLYGVPLMLFVITLQIYTAVILGRCWIIAKRLKPEIELQNRYPYGALAEFIFGDKMSYVVTILLDLTVFGAGIPNLLVASQNMQLLGSRVSHGNFELSFCYWLILIGCLLCPIMWLGSPKNMKPLASVSVVICTSVAFLTWLAIFDDTNLVDNSSEDIRISRENNTLTTLIENYTPFSGLDLTPPPGINLIKAYGIIAFQFDIHPMLLTIQVDMKEKRKIGKAVCYGLITTCTLSAITTILAAYRYGSTTTANVLVMLPRSWNLYVIILLVTLQLCLSSAVGNSALFQHLEDVLGASRNFSFKRCIIRSSLVAFAVLIGELLPKFDVVMSIIGGTLTGPLIFILPPLFYTKILRLEKEFYEHFRTHDVDHDSVDEDAVFNKIEEKIKKKHKGYGAILFIIPEVPFGHGSRAQRVFRNASNICKSDCLLSVLVIMFGLVATFASTYFQIFDSIGTLSDMWSPCVRNISRALTNLV